MSSSLRQSRDDRLAHELQIASDPVQQEQQRNERARAVNASYIPRLRMIGSVVIATWVYLHMRYISGGSLTQWAMAAGALVAYSIAAWAILQRFYRPRARFDLSLFFLTADLVFWTVLIYITGAEKSWLFVLLSVRAADQTPTTFRRTFYFAHVGVFLYVAMLGFIHLEGREIDWGAAWSKAAIIYGFNLYLSLAARTTEDIRKKMTAAIRVSRELIRDLDSKRRELSDALFRTAELERSLAQAQKIESLGQMATGIAHDFNNTMMSALPWAELISRKYRDDPELQHASNQIRSAVHRARDVTSHLLRFAQPKEAELQAIDLGAFIREQLETLRISIPEDIRVVVEEPATPCVVELDSAHFAQTITNLTLNARDAMPEGGTLTFRIREARSGEEGRPDVSSSTHVALDVIDTGVGMDDETVQKIFDPFFTTKPFGRGSGLGLSVVHRTIQQMNAIISVRSKPGLGTTFTILLRCAAGEVHRDALPDGRSGAGARRAIQVLLVDDDPDVIEGLRVMLEMLDADVVAAESGAAALAILDGGLRPDVIITDFGMAGMSGGELHAEIRNRGLTTPVVISSGYGENDRIRRAAVDGRTFYLQKPYSLSDLESLLDRLTRGTS